MVISRETDYAIRILRCIADGEIHNIGQMCDSEHIPRQFGYKIIAKLQDANMLTCTRGRSGGCQLTVDLKSISLLDVMQAIGNECCMNLCLAPDHVCTWKATHMDTCNVHTKLAVMQREMSEKLQGMDMYSVIFE